jgi:energy-coupling factor transporter ATP-binding protein EcfA2
MPTIADEIEGKPSGARFFRADLHIHTFGGSHDVSDTTMTPDAVIKTAVSENLGLIAVTDHNEILNVQGTINAAKATSVVAIPGVELTTPEGHLLVYFDDLAELTSFYGKLSLAGKGTSDSRCQTSLLECLNKIDPTKGFAILAHVDADGGLEKKVVGNPPHKNDIIMHPALLGIELLTAASTISYANTDPEPQRQLLGKNRIKALSLGEKQFLARVLFSDSHSLAALGKNSKGQRRLTRIKMDSPSFAGLRIALQDADARIRLEEEIPQSYPYIMGMSLDGGFVDGHTIHFSRNLNCIIGGRGAGKSTAFEAVRCLSPLPSVSKLVDSEVWPTTIHIVWVDKAGQQHVVRRRINDDPENVTLPEVGAVFPIESYGQNETAQTSVNAQSDPGALLKYLDQFVNLGALQAQDEEIRSALLENQSKIEKAQTEVNRIPEYTKLLASVQQQLKALETAHATEVVALERKVAEERGIRESIEKQVAGIPSQIKQGSLINALIAVSNASKPADLKVGSSEFSNIVGLTNDFQEVAKKSEAEVASSAATFSGKVREQLATWKAREQQFLNSIDQKRKELQAQGIRLDLAYIKKLAADETQYKANLKSLADWETQLKDLQKARIELLSRRDKVRSLIFTARNAYSTRANKVLQNALTDLSVNVKFFEGALSPEAEDIIQQATGWRTSQVPRCALLVEQVTAPGLLEAIRKRDTAPIMKVTTTDGMSVFNKADAQTLLDALSQPSVVFRLQRCEVDDRPRITVTKKIERGGKVQFISRDFAKLSLGQQQSVLLALMLSSESESPLIIDQPEDNLDSEFIFHSLIPVIRAAKERRQVIIVTHNANLAVLGDAEQIVALKSSSDKSMIVAQGSIDDPKTKATVCQILEGAEEAFRRRAKMYGII